MGGYGEGAVRFGEDVLAMAMRVVIADDHRLMLEGIRTALESCDDVVKNCLLQQRVNLTSSCEIENAD